jgi:hypothetical protein
MNRKPRLLLIAACVAAAATAAVLLSDVRLPDRKSEGPGDSSEKATLAYVDTTHAVLAGEMPILPPRPTRRSLRP